MGGTVPKEKPNPPPPFTRNVFLVIVIDDRSGDFDREKYMEFWKFSFFAKNGSWGDIETLFDVIRFRDKKISRRKVSHWLATNLIRRYVEKLNRIPTSMTLLLSKQQA